MGHLDEWFNKVEFEENGWDDKVVEYDFKGHRFVNKIFDNKLTTERLDEFSRLLI